MKERQRAAEEMNISKIRNEIGRLPGVLSIETLDPQIYEKIIELEDRYTQSTMNINIGIMEALARGHQFCILKNDDFRGPPSSTVLMAYKYDAKPSLPDNQIVIFEDMFYSIIGQEKIGVFSEDKIIDTGNFVIFQNRIVKGRKPIYLFPSVAFPELRKMRGVRDVVSSTPCSIVDMSLRRHYGYQEDPHHTGTLVLGFNLEF